MSRPAGIDIFEDKVLRREQYNLQRAVGHMVKQGLLRCEPGAPDCLVPTRKQLLRLQRQGVDLPPELKKQLQKRKRRAKKRTTLKQEIARGFREQKKWGRQRREKPEGPIINIGEREAQAQAVAQAAAMGAAAAAALAPPAAPAAPAAAPIIVPPAAVHIAGGGGGGVGAADIDRIRAAVAGELRGDIAAVRAEQARHRQDVGAMFHPLLRGGAENLEQLEAIRGRQEEMRERIGVESLEQRTRHQLLEAQQAQLVERFDLHHDEFATGRQYAEAMEQAETERLEREERRAAEQRRDIQSIDRRSQELVDEIRAAQVQQGEAGDRRLGAAETRLNTKIDDLIGQIGSQRADEEFARAARAAQQYDPDFTPRRVTPPGKTSPGAAMEELRAEWGTAAASPPSPTIHPLLQVSPRTRAAREQPPEVIPASPPLEKPTSRPGWTQGTTIHDAVAPQPEPEPLLATPPKDLEKAFDWDSGKAEGVDRGKSVGADEKELVAEESKPKRQLLSERLAPGLEDSPEQVAEQVAEGWTPGSEVLEEEATAAEERKTKAAEEDVKAEERKAKQDAALERLEKLPAPPAEEPEGGEGFRSGDVGRGPPGTTSPGPAMEQIREED